MGQLGQSRRLIKVRNNMNIYKYTIYVLYSWGLKKKNDTPVFNVVITLTAVHYFQILTLYCITLKYTRIYNIFNTDCSLFVLIFSIIFLIFNYLILYNKRKWESYLVEYENESKKERRNGRVYVLAYLIGSFLMFFVVATVLFL